MKKHFKFISKSILLSVVSSTMISSGLILSSCVNKKDDNDNNDSSVETPNGEIKIENQSPTTNEVNSDSNLTLYVNVTSSKPVEYQWYVNKSNSKWELIEGATKSSYSITSDLIQDVTQDTTWQYKAEIYDADDPSIKLTSKTYIVNIKPKQTAPLPNPSPDPSPDTNPNPEPNPPIKPDTPSTNISSNSISLNNIGNLLPSQYLTNINNLTLNEDLISKHFDSSLIKNVSYSINELNDWEGTLSILMNYEENSIKKSFIFNFNKLLKLKDGNYHFEFENAADIINLSAQEIAEEKIKSKVEFENFINKLKEQNINFKFKINGIELPINYLDLSGVEIKGFKTSWFTSNEKIVLTFNLLKPKINYYIKTLNNNIYLNNYDYPSNLSKQVTMKFYSASDFLLNKLTNNVLYSSNKYSDYYYYDIVDNNSIESQLMISNYQWLSDVTTKLIYENKEYVYQPKLNINAAPIANNGSLTINLIMEFQSSNTSNFISQTTKNITINGFQKYDLENLFLNSNGNTDNKFFLSCDPSNYDKNINILKTRKELILNEINNIGENETLLFKDIVIPTARIEQLIKNVICKFNNTELKQSNNKDYYSNEYTAIENYYIDKEETKLQYNKNENVFQLVVKNFTIYAKSLNDDGFIVSSYDMTFNITHPKQSLEKLKEA